ncbi:deacetylase [Xaviernesmea oryzae]|uniref:Deacetylase n=1 Tax=Xaviernesmea oryzae TaxID=464029 RepID=A0A1Q9AVF1_9HYPH|nr:acetylxylan esterase [Xaviernesmea oryzae]OLP59431.1 deacetylase [Xaviernesmea oryzae]SEL60281.1 cephalosporin-C deacetylase [Xaviernesmea oryzae]
MTQFKHDYDFDPSHGYTLDMLTSLQPPDAPPGFDAAWSERYARALTVDPRPVLSPAQESHPDWIVHDIAYSSTDRMTIRGWLLTPRTGTVTRGLVVGHGYGGRDAPELDLPVENTAILFPCFRGMSRSAAPPISPNAAWHVLHDIDKPSRYIIGGCVEDLWLAVSALLALFPQAHGRVGYSGISFGGGLGALGIPFDPRIDRGMLEVPTFGNRPLWLKLPCIGSARSVQLYARRHPEVLEMLRMYDAATAAARIRVPMIAAVALFDPAVAPPCQFSIANALPKNDFNQIFILDAGHSDYPENAAQHQALKDRVREHFKAT